MEDGRTAKTQTYTDLESITVGNDGTIAGYHSVHGYIELEELILQHLKIRQGCCYG